MAYLTWRRGSKVYLYYYDSRAGRLVQVPRSVTRAWDNLPREEVFALKRKWEEEHGEKKTRIEKITLGKDDKLKKLWDSYQTKQKRFTKRRDSTARSETQDFETYICAFFVGVHQKKDPTQWHSLVPDFHNWLFERGISESTIRAILWTLGRFGKYLVFSRLMPFPYTIETPKTQKQRVTPLKVRVTPEEVLTVAKTHAFRRPHKKHASTTRVTRINFKLAILLGYFASLGPEELWALEKEDFLTGAEAVEKSKTYAGFRKYNLGSKLAVRINKSLLGSKPVPLLKNDYRFGYVTIWHPDAARLIAQMLKDAPSGRLFPFSRGYLDRYWRELVKPVLGTTAHDLRRASCLYLGRTVRVEPTLLQEHMRHSEMETTFLYTREPQVEEISTPGVVRQDFDDVV